MWARSRLWGVAPFAAMVMLECTDVGITTLSKAAMLRGMSHFVLVVYSNALATLILLPSFIFHRRTRPPLTFSILRTIFLLGLIGCFAQIFTYSGVRYSSPTLASAMGNLIPAFTFILAILFRMEKLDLRSSSSQAKSMGTLVSIMGAFIVTLYKGPPLMMAPSSSFAPDQPLLSPQSNWIIGGLLLAAACLLIATLYNVQTSIVKEYPAELIISLLYCFFATIVSALVSLALEIDPSAWRLSPDIQLIAILYTAVFGSVFRTVVHTWVAHKKGPVYVAMFKPLGVVIAVVMCITFLGDTLHLGSVVGATIIALGFYSVMWGKAREETLGEESGVSRLETSTTPLLQTKIEEI